MSDSEIVEQHVDCPDCGSSDGLCVYDDGHSFCFSCKTHTKDYHGHCGRDAGGDSNSASDSGASRGNSSRNLVAPGDYRSLKARRIKAETCRKFGYTVGTFKDKTVHIAPYCDDKGKPIAQKLRFANKEFLALGDMKNAGLFGQHLWKDGGKRLVITEGEIDAMAYAEATGGTWPVVSIPNGASSAKKSVQSHIDWIDSFEQVVFMFDMDEPGREAAAECADLLTPGKAAIAELPLKDAADMLANGRVKELNQAVWNAPNRRPDGVILGEEITVEDLKQQASVGYPTPYAGLNDTLKGVRGGELVILTAGTGIGKSTMARELGYDLNVNHGLRIANIYLEEQFRKTAQGYVAIHNNVPLGELRADSSILTDEQYEETLETVIRNGRNFFYNHFGSLQSDHLLNKLRYFAVGLECDFIILDHISIVVSGQESSREGERKDIDILMTRLRSLVEETGVGVIAICHLKQPENKPHEEGGRVTLSHLRGSGTLKQLPDAVVALERDQQGEAAEESLVRVLKNREFGDTGPCCFVKYDKETGRLVDAGVPGDEDEDPFEDEDEAPF